MKKLWLRFKVCVVHWLWRGNEWTKLIDDIDQATEEISVGKIDQITIPIQFKYLKNGNFDLVISKALR